MMSAFETVIIQYAHNKEHAIMVFTFQKCIQQMLKKELNMKLRLKSYIP